MAPVTSTRAHPVAAVNAPAAPKAAAPLNSERRLIPLTLMPESFPCGGAMGARLPELFERMPIVSGP
ncbi:hypothetical protein GCM10017688_30540 [Streptomyces ramulosus]